MNKIRPFIYCIIILFAFLILHNVIMTGFANIGTIFRNNNLNDLTIESYKTKIESLEKTLSEYELSQGTLNIFDSSTYILSKIALRDVYEFYDYLVISTKSRIKEGDAVINEKGLVGLVESANQATAKVTLLTGKVKLSVKIGESYGILDNYDKKENLLIVHNINNYQNIEIGSEVLTSGMQNIDNDLKIGTVERIDREGVEQIIYVKPYVDFNNLNYLMVIDK